MSQVRLMWFQPDQTLAFNMNAGFCCNKTRARENATIISKNAIGLCR